MLANLAELPSCNGRVQAPRTSCVVRAETPGVEEMRMCTCKATLSQLCLFLCLKTIRNIFLWCLSITFKLVFNLFSLIPCTSLTFLNSKATHLARRLDQHPDARHLRTHFRLRTAPIFIHLLLVHHLRLTAVRVRPCLHRVVLIRALPSKSN